MTAYTTMDTTNAPKVPDKVLQEFTATCGTPRVAVTPPSLTVNAPEITIIEMPTSGTTSTTLSRAALLDMAGEPTD